MPIALLREFLQHSRQSVVSEPYTAHELSSELSLERGISVYLFKTVTALYHFLTLDVPTAKKASLPDGQSPKSATKPLLQLPLPACFARDNTGMGLIHV